MTNDEESKQLVDIVYAEMVTDFAGDNLDLMDKLFEERPLIYKLKFQDNDKPAMFIDYTIRMPDNYLDYDRLVQESINEARYYGMFRKHDMIH